MFWRSLEVSSSFARVCSKRPRFVLVVAVVVVAGVQGLHLQLRGVRLGAYIATQSPCYLVLYVQSPYYVVLYMQNVLIL